MPIKFSALQLAATWASGRLSYLRAGDGRPRQPRGTMSRGLIAERTRLSLFVAAASDAHLRRADEWPSAAALALCLCAARPAADRAAGSAHRRLHARQRNLCRPLRLRRQDRDLRRPLALRDDPAIDRVGRRCCSGSAGCAICAPPSPAITRSNARALVDDWITVQGAWDAVAWRPEVVARRIISWLTHAPFLLHDADVRFYRRFMRSLTQQVRYLRRTTGDMRDGLPRLQGIIALNLRGALHGRAVAPAQDAPRAGWSDELQSPGPAGRRPHQPQSRRLDRIAARSAAAAAGFRRAQHAAAAPR